VRPGTVAFAALGSGYLRQPYTAMAIRSGIFHALAPVVTVLGALVAGYAWVGSYTRHGQEVEVPSVAALTLSEAEQLLTSAGLLALVVDSMHSNEAPKGSVLGQDPRAGSEVKPGRKVYLTMNAIQPKMVNVPTLVDLSKRQALSVLDIVGLRVREFRHRPDPCTDCVLEALYKGAPIQPDTRIPQGEQLVLVLGSGPGNQLVPLPDLYGQDLAAARGTLTAVSLGVGALFCEGCNTATDSALARVYRQLPSTSTTSVALGSNVDIWLSTSTDLPQAPPTEAAPL
jgi:eukaryotic-like serine/threonine-protein kinase